MNIQAYKRGANIQISPHFRSGEFEPKEKKGIIKTKWILIDLDTIQILEITRGFFNYKYKSKGGVYIKITSGYRHPIHNICYSKKNGKWYHTTGSAIDFKMYTKKDKKQISPEEIGEFLNAIVFDGGVGAYKSFNHVDQRGEIARWPG